MQNTTDRLLNLTMPELSHTTSVRAQLLDSLKSGKSYRHAFVEEKVQTQLAIQIKTIREQREMARSTFATLLRKAVSWVFRLEDPNQSPPTISTLLNVAEAFDVDLEIRFRGFSDLLNEIDNMTPDFFEVPSFDEEVKKKAFDVIAMHHSNVSNVAASETASSENKPKINGAPPMRAQARLGLNLQQAAGGNS